MKHKVFLISALSLLMLSAAPVYAQNIKTDLPVYVEGIDERNLKSVALTDSYNVDILTKASHEARQKVAEFEKQQDSQLCDQLSLKDDKITIENTENVLKQQNLSLFSKPCNYENRKNVKDSSKINIFLYVFIFISLGLISSLGALAFKQTKRRKKNVYNRHNANVR